MLSAAYRARMLNQGHSARIESKNKPAVTATREIADGKVGTEMLKKGCPYKAHPPLAVLAWPFPRARPATSARPLHLAGFVLLF